MKLFLIKFGKVFSTIRRDGIIVGGRRVWNYLILFAKTLIGVKSGDVLILTGGVGDSAHYRAYTQAEEFNLHKIKASVMLQDNPFLSSYADKFKVFIFHRTIQTPTVSKLINRIKKLNKEIIFETDDLVFDVKYIHQTDLYKNKMSYFEKKQYEKGVGEEILNDPYVKICSTTTTYLARILESYGKKVFISKNKIINHELEIAERILKEVPKENDNFIKLGYYSGTSSHNKDFATIIDALVEIFRKFNQVKLILAGPLDLDERLDFYREKIIRFPLVSRDKYQQNLYKADINLAPLVPNDPFCESKSEIKFSGAGIFGIPTVAVKNQTFSEAIEDGVDGFLAENTEEWINKLEKLITDENLRREMGRKAREKVLRDYTNKNSHNEEYYNYLRSKI
jgi:glycosyltransferase involved in cell wall biosynthesis